MPKATKAPGELAPMLVTPDERRLLLSRRGDSPARREQVIDRYREPRTIAELMEVIRVILTTNFDYLVDEHMPEHQRLDIQGGSGLNELPPTSIVFGEDGFSEPIEKLLRAEAAARKAGEKGKAVPDA